MHDEYEAEFPQRKNTILQTCSSVSYAIPWGGQWYTALVSQHIRPGHGRFSSKLSNPMLTSASSYF